MQVVICKQQSVPWVTVVLTMTLSLSTPCPDHVKGSWIISVNHATELVTYVASAMITFQSSTTHRDLAVISAILETLDGFSIYYLSSYQL